MLRHADAVGCKATNKAQHVTLAQIATVTDGDFRILVEECSVKVFAAANTPESDAKRAAKAAKKAEKKAAKAAKEAKPAK
jgi:hypothetical protein